MFMVEYYNKIRALFWWVLKLIPYAFLLCIMLVLFIFQAF